MPYQPKILAFAGSLRKDSLNKKAVRVAAEAARQAGAEVNFIDLKDFPVPPYDGDIEASDGLPENAVKLQNLMLENDGFLISSPEYNSGIPGTFKNYIDWTSRPHGDRKAGAVYANKYCSLMTASPGNLGGIRALPNIRTILSSMGVNVLPQDFALAKAAEAFDENGNPKSDFVKTSLEKMGKNLVEILIKVKS